MGDLSSLNEKSDKPTLEHSQHHNTTIPLNSHSSALTKPMPLPSLPEDLWYFISTMLAPAELSSLRLVNQALHKVATDLHHFRRVIRTTTDTKHPVIEYRRIRALHNPPNQFSSTHLPSLEFLCIVQDTLLFIELKFCVLRAFPSGLKFNLRNLIGGFANLWTEVENFEFMRKNMIVLPEGHVAMLLGFNPTVIIILNVKNGRSKGYVLNGPLPHIQIADKQAIVPGGNHAEYLIYCPDPNTPNVIDTIDWRSGARGRWRWVGNHGKFVSYVMCECPGLGGMSVVGVVTERELDDGSCQKMVVSLGVDRVYAAFNIPEEAKVRVALRSVDKKTHVLVYSHESESSEASFIAYRRNDDSQEMSFTGSLSTKGWPELRENGRLITIPARCIPFWRTRASAPFPYRSSVQVAVELKDDGSTEGTVIPEIRGRPLPVWLRKTADGMLALMVSEYVGVIELVKFVEVDEVTKEIRLKRWCIDGLHDLCVFDDHFIFAKSADGKSHQLHFDQFCNGARGIFACPVVTARWEACRTGMYTYPARKRRRVAHGGFRTY